MTSLDPLTSAMPRGLRKTPKTRIDLSSSSGKVSRPRSASASPKKKRRRTDKEDTKADLNLTVSSSAVSSPAFSSTVLSEYESASLSGFTHKNTNSSPILLVTEYPPLFTCR